MVRTSHLMWRIMWVIMAVGRVMARVYRWAGIVVVQMSRFQIAESMRKSHPEQQHRRELEPIVSMEL